MPLWVLACLLVVAAAVGLVLALIRRSRAEFRRRLELERARIARDLHDELGSGLGSLGILAGLAAEPALDESARRDAVERIASGADALGTALTDIVWSLRPDVNSVAALAAHLVERSARLFPGEETALVTRLPEVWPPAPLSIEARRGLQAIALEALHNAARHAHARHVEFGIAPDGRRWKLWVEDDGRGLAEVSAPRADGHGRGLANMRRRAEEIGAAIAWSPRPGGGTRVEVEFDSGSARRALPATVAAPPLRTVRPPLRMHTTRTTAFYGREAELDRLRDLFREAQAGHGGVVLIEGEAGIGKTRLIDEFTARLRSDEVAVRFLYGSYPPGGAATATNAFAHAFREHLGETRLPDLLRDYLSDTPSLVPAFAALLRGEAPPRGDPTLTKDAMHTLFGNLTRALALEVPTLLVIDDLHFAPEEGRALFAALALAVPAQRVLLAGTLRPEISEAWIAGFARMEHMARLPIPRLDMESRERLLQEASALAPLPAEIVAEIATRSDGNPFFALELMREMHSSATRSPGGTLTADSPPVPRRIRDLIAARLASLASEDRDLLELASCWGFEFDPQLIAAASGADVPSALRRCTRIEREYRLLRQLETTYVFDHHQIQEVLYERLFPPLRAQYHGALAGALEQRARINPAAGGGGQVAVQLCSHFFAGDQDERALGYLDAALDHLATSNSREARVKLAERALSAAGLLTGERRIGVLIGLAGDFEMMARFNDGRPALEEALELARNAGDRVLESRVLRHLGINTTRRGGRVADEVSEFERAQALAREAGNAPEEILASGNLAVALRVLGRYEESKTISEKMLELARRTGDHAGEVHALGALGSVLMGLGEPERALAAHTQGLTIAQSLPDRAIELRSTIEVGTTLWGLHRHQEAREYLERTITMARATGHRIYEMFAWIRIGDVALDSGQYAEAREVFQKLLPLAETSGRRAEVGATNFGLLQAHLGLGHLTDALAHAQQTRAVALERGSKILEEDVSSFSGVMMGQLGAMDEARESLARAIAMAAAAQATRRVASMHWQLGRLHEQAEDLAAARGSYQTALDMALDLDESRLRAPLLADLGGLLLTQGSAEEAHAHLEGALSLAQELDLPGTRALALAHRARLPGGDQEAAAAALVACEHRLPRWEAMLTHFVLWEAAGDRSDLAAAHGILVELIAHAPESYRPGMLANVRLHRRIAEAWRAAGDHPEAASHLVATKSPGIA